MPLALESQTITEDVWPLFQDSSGRILDQYSVRKWTFYKGISVKARPKVWRFLLGYFPFSSTADERQRIDDDKRYQYETLLASWNRRGSVPDSKFSDYERVIEKDSCRTDRDLPFYSGEGSENAEKLQRILKTFVAYDPEMGYIQGMNDVLSVLLVTLQSEHQAFWCFTEVITRMRPTLSDLTLSQPLRGLARLCWYLDAPLHQHIVSVYGEEDWVFCYRWELLQLKREFSVKDTCVLWERIWSDHATGHFQQFLMMAVLEHYREQLLECSTVEHFMEFCMKLPGNIPLDPVLSLAQGLLQRLREDEYCPHELRYLVSSDGCAPPPLVGFVRARQKFTTLHSTKIKLQRDQIWKSLFGDTPVQPITSPFMLSPVRNQSDDLKITSLTPGHAATNGSCAMESHQFESNSLHAIGNGVMSTTEYVCPPKAGFVPRKNGIQFREDIRKTLHLCCEQSATGTHSSSNSVRAGSESHFNGGGNWQASAISSTGGCETPQLPLSSYSSGAESDYSSEVKTEGQVSVPGHQSMAPFHAATQPHNGHFPTVLQHNGYSPDDIGNSSHSVSSVTQGHIRNGGHQNTYCDLETKPTFDILRSEPEL